MSANIWLHSPNVTDVYDWIVKRTSLISIESQPKKVVFIMVLVVAVFHVVDVIVVVEPRNIPLKFGQILVIDIWDIVVVIIVIVVVYSLVQHVCCSSLVKEVSRGSFVFNFPIQF